MKVTQLSESHSLLSNSLRPHELYSPRNSPGQNTGVSSLFLLQVDLPNPGIESVSPELQVDSLTELSGKPLHSSVIRLFARHTNFFFKNIHFFFLLNQTKGETAYHFKTIIH